MKSYTLEEIAHFDRCLFPGNFRDDLVSSGITDADALMVAYFIIGHRRKGGVVSIVSVYQEFIDEVRICAAINDILEKFTGR